MILLLASTNLVILGFKPCYWPDCTIEDRIIVYREGLTHVNFSVSPVWEPSWWVVCPHSSDILEYTALSLSLARPPVSVWVLSAPNYYFNSNCKLNTNLNWTGHFTNIQINIYNIQNNNIALENISTGGWEWPGPTLVSSVPRLEDNTDLLINTKTN